MKIAAEAAVVTAVAGDVAVIAAEAAVVMAAEAATAVAADAGNLCKRLLKGLLSGSLFVLTI